MSIALLVALIANCAPTQTNTPQASEPSAEPVIAGTLSPKDKIATAMAIDQATKASKPTVIPSPTKDLSAAGGWWNDTVFYEIFVRSFYDSDGDGVGDINGVIEKLDYLNDGDPNTTTDLGVTGIWLMPITESPSYHGYDVVDYYSVDQEYGTEEDFHRLIDEAHKRGIKIIIDLVINHTSTQNPWFKASNDGDPKYRDWYIWSDSVPGYLGPWGQNVWYGGKDGYYYALFWSEMPDLNFRNPVVTEEIENVARYWIEDMNVDGFRMDAIRHLIEDGQVQENTTATHDWLKDFHKAYKEADPQAFTVGEAWTSTTQAAKYTIDEMDIVFEFDLALAMINAANGPQATAAMNQLKSVLRTYPKNQYGVFLTNHDQNRSMGAFRDLAKAKNAAVMLLTAPGVPFIYYGEEIGMIGAKPDEDIRRPMQWSGNDAKVGFTTGKPWRSPNNDYADVNAADQLADPNSLLSTYRELIHLRNEHSALRNGDTIILDTQSPRLYAILRYDQQEAVLILINVHQNALKKNQLSLSLANGTFSGSVKALTLYGTGVATAPAINATGGFDSYNPLEELPGYSAIIIQLK